MVYSDRFPASKVTVFLKVLIVVLLIGVVVSLFSGLVFLFKDTDRSDSKRTLYALGVRVTFATALLITIFYGFYTGQLRMGVNAPWHGATPAQAAPAEPAALDQADG